MRIPRVLAIAAAAGLSVMIAAGPALAQSEPAGGAPATAPSTMPASHPADPDVLAYVNGKALPMSPVVQVLIRNYGMQVAQQAIAAELVEQELAKRNLSVTDSDARAESDLTLLQFFGRETQGEQRDNLLAQFLAQQGTSREVWDMTMRRNAMLRKMVEPKIRVTDEMLKDEFGTQYGRKVIVRHIQLPTLQAAQDLLKKLQEGADFAALAREHSINQSRVNGGLLPAIGAKTPGVPPAILQAAIAMKKVGDISQPVESGTAFHLLKLDQVIEPQNIKFDDAKKDLTDSLRERQIRVLQQETLRDLLASAQREGRIEFGHPILRSKASEVNKP